MPDQILPKQDKHEASLNSQIDAVNGSNGDSGSKQDAEQDSANSNAKPTPNLPGSEEIWRQCPFGAPESWPDELKAFSMTVSCFPYPACIFWGEELVLLHNEQWTQVEGNVSAHGQGQKQRGKLSADVFQALTAALRGGMPQRIQSSDLLRSDAGDDDRGSTTVLISPLFTDEKGQPCGLMAQLLPNSKQGRQKLQQGFGSYHEERKGDDDPAQRPQQFDMSKLGSVVDSIPLDEHPFFHRFAEMLPTGLAILDHRAQAVFVNQHFYSLTTHRGDDKTFKSWPQTIHPDDYDRVMDAYHDAFTSQKQLRTEFRSVGHNHPWRLLLLTPLGDENLQHVSLRHFGGFICSIVDISSEKSAELNQRQAAREAQERKEQQERFIDMISHEIRNPLSALLHCSEDIADAISDEKKIDIGAIKDAVETINICIQHQRNIVDDVLSYSKLDAAMLSLVPSPSLPCKGLANALKMFQPEFRKQDMKFGYRIDQSYVDYHVNWVMADLARISQVLINLVSNAIKFTAKASGQKRVVVSIGASLARPTSYPPNVVFFSSEDRAYRMDVTNKEEWGQGDPLYVLVAVKDTGIGITDEDQKKLFERFRQATPKTGEVYGGSGLGLNISRKLCHLHGGEIGVSSKEGQGSTFGFFFRVRKSEPPEDYDGRIEDDELGRVKLKNEVINLGNVSPDEMNEDFMPESVVNPPVEKTEEASPNPSGRGTVKFDKTAEVAADVKSPGIDQNAPRPDMSKRPIARLDRQHTRARVLLVEDNIINQKIVHRKLESKGFKVTTANNGQEAVDTMKAVPKASSGDRAAFDIVLMDSEMPIMDGNTATRLIRKLEREQVLERIPILGVTANVRSAQQEGMTDAGMDDVMSKPYKIEDMVARIERLIGVKQESEAKDS
ncbi:hypothetical protein EJ03DRAFT_325315 [Teratosphaeria nubilosa]|uniref:Histidine kinase HHK12p n=1 Tax=Teratosphaeria nubilosa TaxID=161662 RepID=A0A6G1LFD8_9PEZI|nr:hypothetical protein EJ03DRAFT_325315 [Teratosphaeria nubilosa]